MAINEIKDYGKVSIIIPIYNVEKYIDKCLNSVLNQTYKNIEVLMIDDGSPDNSKDICKRYLSVDSRFCYYYKENGGLSDARNYGLDRMTGDYIFFLDSDDYIEYNAIEILTREMALNDVDIVECSFSDDYFQNIKNNNKRLLRKYSREEALSIDLISKNGIVNAWGKLYKKKIFEKVRYRKGKLYEDLFAITDIYKNVNSVLIINDQLYIYNKRQDGIMGFKFRSSTLDIIEASDYNYEIVKKHFPQALPAAVFRKHYSRFYVLDKAIVNRDGTTDVIVSQMIEYINQNTKSILSDKYFRTTRKIGSLVLLVSKNMYRWGVLLIVRIRNKKRANTNK